MEEEAAALASHSPTSADAVEPASNELGKI